MRGYEEDEEAGRQGTSLNVTSPSEAALYAARLATQLGEDPQILMRCYYTGLAGRQLTVPESWLAFLDDHVCHDAEVALEIQANATEINDNLAELIHPLLSPLYERFDFFALPMDVVTRELERMRGSRF